eukprot:TRINITY_DN10692_c0_g1_i4.p1 TRINITY_DN10692_c0_g1~~TRINITY_DN10692_c0_g1_i4.p1  ORF type:complete len:158 (-),score=20.30 TRINITY_DN10692_c0_g1_i4:32-505(-)
MQVNQEAHAITCTIKSPLCQFILPVQNILTRDWRRATGNIRFKTNHPLLGDMEVQLTWQSDNVPPIPRHIVFTDFDVDYLKQRLWEKYVAGTPLHNCMVKITASPNPNYIPVSLSHKGMLSQANYHTIWSWVYMQCKSGKSDNGECMVSTLTYLNKF